ADFEGKERPLIISHQDRSRACDASRSRSRCICSWAMRRSRCARTDARPALERFLKDEAGDGPVKSFTLRGIKDNPPYMHDGRCLTLEDTVPLFNLLLELTLNKEEKHDLVAFLWQP